MGSQLSIYPPEPMREEVGGGGAGGELSRSLGLVGLLGGLVVEGVVRGRWGVWEVVVGMAGLCFGVRRWWACGLV